MFPSVLLDTSSLNQSNFNHSLTQGITSVFSINIYIGFPSLYATFVCVACSQLEKLGAALINIRQARVATDQDCVDETDDQGSERQTHTSELLFRRMREQLSECIRHHQQLKRCDHYYHAIQLQSLSLLRAR